MEPEVEAPLAHLALGSLGPTSSYLRPPGKGFQVHGEKPEFAGRAGWPSSSRPGRIPRGTWPWQGARVGYTPCPGRLGPAAAGPHGSGLQPQAASGAAPPTSGSLGTAGWDSGEEGGLGGGHVLESEFLAGRSPGPGSRSPSDGPACPSVVPLQAPSVVSGGEEVRPEDGGAASLPLWSLGDKDLVPPPPEAACGPKVDPCPAKRAQATLTDGDMEAQTLGSYSPPAQAFPGAPRAQGKTSTSQAQGCSSEA